MGRHSTTSGRHERASASATPHTVLTVAKADARHGAGAAAETPAAEGAAAETARTHLEGAAAAVEPRRSEGAPKAAEPVAEVLAHKADALTELRAPEPADFDDPFAEGEPDPAHDAAIPDAEDPSFAVEHEGDLWPDAEIIPEEKALARRFSEKDAPEKRRRFNPSGKGFLLGMLKVVLFILVALVGATVVWSAVYMVGTHTPIADMPAELLGFFQRLFA